MNKKEYIMNLMILEHTAKCYFKLEGTIKQQMLEQGVRVDNEMTKAILNSPDLLKDEEVLQEIKDRKLVNELQPLLIEERVRQIEEQKRLFILAKEKEELDKIELKRKEKEALEKLTKKYIEGFDNDSSEDL
jgi:hypothetical protein